MVKNLRLYDLGFVQTLFEDEEAGASAVRTEALAAAKQPQLEEEEEDLEKMEKQLVRRHWKKRRRWQSLDEDNHVSFKKPGNNIQNYRKKFQYIN